MPANTASAKIKSAAKKGKAVAGSMPFLKKHINTEPSDETGLSNKKGSASVQLWTERKCWFSGGRYATSKARAEREVPPRRVVIYGVGMHGKSIAILRFHQNFKLEEDDSAQLVRFIPTNKARDEFFAGIPIDSQLLRKYEDENSIDCKAVSMKFKNSEERIEFADDYLWMREDWRKERHGEV
ncbi:protein kinase domain-containing protein [Neofusicoccum parvum]|nr:protein kinase domain-containing protein [Neofusicoccum parvum]